MGEEDFEMKNTGRGSGLREVVYVPGNTSKALMSDRG